MRSLCRDLALFIRRDPRICCGRRRGPRHVRVTPLGLRRLQTSERLKSHLTSSWRVRRPPLRRLRRTQNMFVLGCLSFAGDPWSFFFKWRKICRGKKEITAVGVNYMNSKLGD